jgi:hypothetical protein
MLKENDANRNLTKARRGQRRLQRHRGLPIVGVPARRMWEPLRKEAHYTDVDAAPSWAGVVGRLRSRFWVISGCGFVCTHRSIWSECFEKEPHQSEWEYGYRVSRETPAREAVGRQGRIKDLEKNLEAAKAAKAKTVRQEIARRTKSPSV